MAYTRDWNNATPAGTRAAKEIDDAAREHKVDIYERFLTLLDPATDFDDDPLVLKAELTGLVEGKIKIVPFCSFVMDGADASGDNYRSNRLVIPAIAAGIYAPVIMPPGAVITKIEWVVSNDDTNTLTAKFRSVIAGTVLTEVDENVLTSNTSGTHLMTSGVLAITIANNKSYYLTIDKGTGTAYAICSVIITYDVADSRITD